MSTVRILRLPGGGASMASVPTTGTSLDALVASEGLTGRDIMVNCRTIARSAFATTMVKPGDRIAATESVKGA